ncbi:MAG: glycosyltransferase [Candidatus Aminicenantes bacterium]|nr:glycosyltransferase [Candidatus Aminicenantes bacterium]
MNDFKNIWNLINSDHPEQSLNQISSHLEKITKNKGVQHSYNILLKLEVVLGLRKPRVALYDNALHFIGGAQKYGCTIANALKDVCDVTLISHRKISLEQLKDWYGMDLSPCQIKVIEIPFFEERTERTDTFDAGEADLKGENPFHAVSKESGEHDIFINNCMLEMVYPLSNVSEFVCHFPERERSRFFHVDQYTHIICNSQYTGEWIKRKWDLEPDEVFYPPVEMMPSTDEVNKEKMVLSVSRFELSGKKQQLEMVRIFEKMLKKYPQQTKGWHLVIAGGSVDDNPYLERVRMASKALPAKKIELKVNLSLEEIKELYQRARIFWHLAGLEQIDPERAEHFGMTTVEAMQNKCVPVVYRGGGQKEIIKDQKSGLFFDTKEELMDRTHELMGSPSRLETLAQTAFEESKSYTKQHFQHKVTTHFDQILKEYGSV